MNLSVSNIAIANTDDDEAYAMLQRCGYNGLEIAPSRFIGSAPYNHLAIAKAKAIEIKNKYGFSIPSMQSIWYGEIGNIFSSDDAKRLSLYTCKAIDFAKAIKCPSLVFGCPKNRYVLDGQSVNDVVPFFTDIANSAFNAGSSIALEANPPIYGTNFINTTKDAFDFARNIPHLMVNYDVGTCIINRESLHILGDNISLVSHIHVSEPELAPIEHRELHRELAELLREKEYKGFVSIEMKAQSLSSLQSISEYVAEVFC
ncbi:MAG: TIM barrel protein [Oscillospiraceae bacterium]